MVVLSDNTHRLMTPIPSPDSIRKMLQLLKSFYDGYTYTNMNHVDSDGLQYNGTVENFGSEIYVESRKMMMDKAPIELVFPDNTFSFYFDIMYSELINTYEQQNMFVATLKDDVLRNNCSYRLIFSDCVGNNILRSESWSDPDVYRDHFINTTTPPVLEITYPDESVETIDLIASQDSSYNITYGFHVNKTTEHLIDTFEDGVLTTKEITFRHVNLPLVWINSSSFNILPDIGFVNNLDFNDNTLLTVGTDGHSVSHLYPLAYANNYPEQFNPEDGLHWFIKVTPIDIDAFDEEGNHKPSDEVEVGSITFVRALYPWNIPTISKTITYDHEYVKIFINGDIDWSYHTPVEGDSDYDGATYINRRYAYVNLDEAFEYNNIDLYPDGVMTPGFTIKFNHMFLNPFEHLLLNAVSGIHMETCSDYSDNGVIKKNGFIHSLGDFDGLPSYFKILRDKDEHRSHFELYSIRDRLNRYNQKATNKQTAAIIMDSGVPRKDLDEILAEMEIVIEYDFNSHRKYHTVGTPVSSKNYLSSIVYINGNKFGDDKSPGRKNFPHFIYHGNRFFSLKVTDLDPELEYGRVYVISNDGINYENNDKTDYPKAARCIARICDIPTDTTQLIHISGVAPTVIIDPLYIHNDASYTDEDIERLWNELQSKWVTVDHDETNLGIYSYNYDLDVNINSSNILSKSYGEYVEKINLNPYVEYGDCVVAISDTGSDYEIDDTFTFYIGGILVTGTVVNVDAGNVTEMTLDIRNTTQINIANLIGQTTIFDTTTRSGVGSGLRISIKIPDEIYDVIMDKTSSDIYDGLYVFKFDEYGFLWVWEYNKTSNMWIKVSQITGPKITYNPYDIEYQNKRSTGDVIIYNELIPSMFKYGTETQFHQYTTSSDISVDIPISDITTFDGPDYQNTYYILNNTGSDTYRIEYYTSDTQDTFKNYYLLPRYNSLNLYRYRGIGSNLHRMISVNNSQVVMGYYNPMKKDITQYENVSQDVYDVTNKPMTFIDVIDSSYIDNTGVLLKPVYWYNEFRPFEDYETLEMNLNMSTRSLLIQRIRSDFPNALLLGYESTSYEYTKNELVDYILSNYYQDPVYKRHNIERMRNVGEQVVEFNKDEIKPIGTNPTGGYELLVDQHDPNVEMDSTSYTTEILFMFKIDNVINNLNDFRIYDDMNNDVSKNSLLIMNNIKYYFDISDYSWKSLS